MGFPGLETERLKLVEVEGDHIERYFEIMSRKDVMEFYGMPPLADREQAATIVRSFREKFEKKKGMRWGILRKDTENFIGTVGLNNLNTYSRKAEIGYELHPEHWRKGYTSEAVKAVLSYAYQELGLFRIGAVTFPENEASSRLLTRLGFKEEGLLRGYLYQEEKNYDAIMFSILREEFLSKGT